MANTKGEDWMTFNANYDDDLPINGSGITTKEDLEDLLETTTYKTDSTWNSDVVSLRNEAISHPDRITHDYIQATISSLCLNGKKITEIDVSMGRFRNLQSLSLTGNLLTQISSTILPEGLQELELSGNIIKDLDSLTHSALPQLRYLGISHNEISKLPTNKHMGEIWPRIVMIDASWNKIDCLDGTTATLVEVNTSLKSITLFGNPITLCKAYRWQLINRLANLAWLDEGTVLSSKRLKYIGLENMEGAAVNDTEMEINIGILDQSKQLFEEKKEHGHQYPQILRFLQIEFSFDDERKESAAVKSKDYQYHTQEKNQSENEMIDFNCHETMTIASPSKAMSLLSHGMTLKVLCHDVTFGLEPLQSEDDQTVEGEDDRAHEVHGSGGKRGHSGKAHPEKQNDQRRMSAAIKAPNTETKQMKKGKDKKEDVKLYEWSRSTTVVRYGRVQLRDIIQGNKTVDLHCKLHEHIEDTLKDHPTVEAIGEGKVKDDKDEAGCDLQKKQSHSENGMKSKKQSKQNKAAKSPEKLNSENEEHQPDMTLMVAVRLNTL